MAGGMDLGTTGRGRRKPLDAAINLVPFIDLMAVLISFLIMTAVWTQTGRLEVSGGTSREDAAGPPPRVTLHLSATGVRIDGALPSSFLVQNAGAHLKEVREGLGGSPQVVVRSDDDVPYGEVVKLVDACIGAGMPDVSVEAG